MVDFTGGPDNDTFIGGDQNDTVTGNGGNDQLSGNGEADDMSGGAGSDTLDGGDGNDRLYSGDRAPEYRFPYYNNEYALPILDTGAETDVVRGGDGSGRLYVGYGDTVDGGANGTSEGDYLYISLMGATTGVTADFRQTTLTIGGATISNIEYVQYVQGSNYNDVLQAGSESGIAGPYGYAEFGVLSEMGGDDRLTAGYYTGSLFGGDGDDLITGIGVIYGGAGNDRIELQSTVYTGYRTYGDDGDDVI